MTISGLNIQISPNDVRTFWIESNQIKRTSTHIYINPLYLEKRTRKIK